MRKQNNPSQVFLHILQEAEISAIPKTQNMETVNLLSHVRLVCDIYCAHACRCYSTLFCFWKLKPKRLIFLINCRSNFKMSIVNRSKKNEKQMINHAHTNQGKRHFWFQAFNCLVLCCWRSWSWCTWLKPRELERKYLKIWSWDTYRFLWNISR